MTRQSKRWGEGRFEAADTASDFLAEPLPRGSRFDQRQDPGGAPWALEIVKPGLSTTVQDLGRPGYYHLGIPESGGMDRYSLIAANLLVGNPGERRRARGRLSGARDSCLARFHHRGVRRRDAAQGRRRRAAGLDGVSGQSRTDALIRLSQERRARLYRDLRRAQRADRVGIAAQPTRSAPWRLRGTRIEGGRQARVERGERRG